MIRHISKYFLLTILACLPTISAFSAKVTISGKAPGYEQKSIELFAFHDFISGEVIKLGIIRFGSDGSFSTEVDVAEITLCAADFDGWRGLIYLEPGKKYQLVFPPKQTETEAPKKNPFLGPEIFWFGLQNPNADDLNVRIQKFEQAYSEYENLYFNQIFGNQDKSLADSVKTLLKQKFPKTSQPFFESHKHFRLSSLDFAVGQGKSPGFMASYFSSEKPVYQLDAYHTAFKQVFQNYFETLANSQGGSQVSALINAGKLGELDAYCQKQLRFNPALSHWILLQGMADGYYSKLFSKASILKMLDQVKTLGWSPYEQETARLIRTKLTWLASGTIPPAIVFTDLSGKNIKLSDFAGKYIYLHFTNPGNSICQQHLDALKEVVAHYKDKLVIINVIPKGASLKPGNSWPGLFVTTSANIDATFRVKTFPTAYLMAKDGKLLLSPAPNPIDGLDRQLGQIFKSDHLKELRESGK